MKTVIRRSALIAAYAIAIGADLLQICLFPFFVEGGTSPLDDFSDVVIGLILTLLLGWHIAFLPSFLVKLIPVIEIAPTWTLAVFIATRNRRTTGAMDVSPPPNHLDQAKEIQEDQPPKTLPENRSLNGHA